MITLADLMSYFGQGGGGGDGFEPGIEFNLDNNFQVVNDAGTIVFDDTGLNITNGAFDLVSTDGDVDITGDAVALQNGTLTASNNQGVEYINEYGFNMYYVDYFKNMVFNSSFEIFDSGTLTPTYWQGTGTSDPNSNFYGSYSCKLDASEYIEQDTTGQINPAFFDNQQGRVSFHRKLGQMKLEVYDVTNATNFTLTAEDGTTGTSITYVGNSNWQSSRVSAYFDPTEHGSCTALRIKITNTHASETGYIDAVMLSPDYSLTVPQIYKDGPRSSGVVGTEQGIVVGTTPPTNTNLLWYDTN